MSALDLNVELRPQVDNHYELTISFHNQTVSTAASPTGTYSEQVRFDWESAYLRASDAKEIGQWLGELIFGAESAAQLLDQALASAAELETSLRCRFSLPPELQSLPWETMYTPQAGLLAASERILFSRYLPSDNYRPAVRLRREALQVSLSVAAPDGLESYNLPAPDVSSIANTMRDALGEDQLQLIPATRRGLLKTLRDGAGIVCLAAHGVFPRGSREPYIFLAGERGDVARVPAAELANDLASLKRLPRLIVLLSCHSAGSDAALGSPDEALLSLGAQLVNQGVPAVVAIRGSISFTTAGEFLASFFSELSRDWVIDRALGAARRNILDRFDAWAPVLFMRLADGWLAKPTTLEAEFSPPPLPPDYIHRPEAYEAVIKRLLQGTERDEPHAVGITATALAGAGGFGKTTLAQAICKDARLIDAFPDGILWVTLGEGPDNLPGLVNKLTTYLSGSEAAENNLEAAMQALAASAASQQLLIVIDDVWQAEHVRPFLINQPGCVILLTTRNSKTLPDNAARIPVESMARREAVALLRHGIADGSGLAWEDVARRMGDWPLLLKLANSALQDRLRQGLNTEQAVADLLQAYDSFGITGFDVQDSQARQQAVSRTLKMSTRRLQKTASYGQHVVDEAARFEELVIFAEDVDIPVETLAVFWRPFGFDEIMVRRLCQRLFELSLLLQFDRQADTIRLHDVIRQYLAGKVQAKALHRRLVASYRELSEPDWQAFPNHAYMAEYAPYHMHAAGCQSDLDQLLFSFAWMRHKLAVTYSKALVADYDNYGDKASPAIRQVAEALRLVSGILSEDNELSGQLYGRLIGTKFPQVKTLIGQIEAQLDAAWLRPRLPVEGQPGGALLLTLSGITGSRDPIVAVNRSGTLAAIGEGSSISVWDLENGVLLHYWLGAHSDQVTAMCFEPGGKYLVTAGGRREARGRSVRQDHTTGRLRNLTDFRTRSDELMDQIYPPENHVKIWSMADGALQYTLQGHESSVNCVAASLDARIVVSGSSDLTVRVWDGNSGKLLQTHTGHEDTILAVAVSQDSSAIISAALDDYVRVWDMSSEISRKFRLSFHMMLNPDAVINADQCLIISKFADKIQLWNLTGKEEVIQADNINASESYPRFINFNRNIIRPLPPDETIKAPGGNWIGEITINEAGDTVVSTIGPDIYIWKRGQRKLKHRLRQRGERITALAVDEPAHLAVTASGDKGVAVWDITKPAGKKKPNFSSVSAVTTSSRSKLIAVATEDGIIYLVNRTNGRINTMLQKAGPIALVIREIFFGYDNRLFEWVGDFIDLIFEFILRILIPSDSALDEDEEYEAFLDKAKALWNRRVPGPIRRPLEHFADCVDDSFWTSTITMSKDGKLLAVGFNNGLVKVWRKGIFGSWSLHARWRANSDDDDVEQIALVDENTLLTASDHDGVATWEINTGRLLARFEAEYIYFLRGEQMQAIIASDNKNFITKRTNRQNDLHLRLVDLRSGVTLHEITCAKVQAVALDRSGLVFAFAGDSKNYWWELDQGTQSVFGDAASWDEFAGEDTLVLDDRHLIFATGYRSLEIVDMLRAQEVATWTPLGQFTAHTIDWENKQIIFGRSTGDIQILDLMNAPET